MYARLLDTILTDCVEDSNGILFIRFPIVELAAALSRNPMTVKRSLNGSEQAGMIMHVRQGVGETNRIYPLLPTDEQVSMILELLFHRCENRKIIEQILAEKPENEQRKNAGNGEDRFQSGKPELSPLKEGATIHHV